jgi:hypothetical protein
MSNILCIIPLQRTGICASATLTGKMLRDFVTDSCGRVFLLPSIYAHVIRSARVGMEICAERIFYQDLSADSMALMIGPMPYCWPMHGAAQYRGFH